MLEFYYMYPCALKQLRRLKHFSLLLFSDLNYQLRHKLTENSQHELNRCSTICSLYTAFVGNARSCPSSTDLNNNPFKQPTQIIWVYCIWIEWKPFEKNSIIIPTRVQSSKIVLQDVASSSSITERGWRSTPLVLAKCIAIYPPSIPNKWSLL